MNPQQMRATPKVQEFDARLAALQEHYADRPAEAQEATERAREACTWAGTENPWAFLAAMEAQAFHGVSELEELRAVAWELHAIAER